MTPDEVSKEYIKQAEKLYEFVQAIDAKKYSDEEYKMIIKILADCYYKLLINLATNAPLLSAYSVTFFKIKALNEREKDLTNPPFEEDFFNNKDI